MKRGPEDRKEKEDKFMIFKDPQPPSLYTAGADPGFLRGGGRNLKICEPNIGT